MANKVTIQVRKGIDNQWWIEKLNERGCKHICLYQSENADFYDMFMLYWNIYYPYSTQKRVYTTAPNNHINTFTVYF
jgi:hypothetical protein